MSTTPQLPVGEYLEVASRDGTRRFSCVKCGHDLGPVEQNYKLSTMAREVEVSESGPLGPDPKKYIDDEIVLRQYFCPGCMTLLDNEINRAGSPPLWDVELSQ